jgi:ribonuclease HI
MKLVINTDGGARGNPGPAGIGVVFTATDGNIVGQFKEYIGAATNNVAEYQALVLALEEAKKTGAEQLQIRMDSELIVRQMQGRYKIKDPGLKILATDVLRRIKNFKNVEFVHVPREQNKLADKLVNEAIDKHLA